MARLPAPAYAPDLDPVEALWSCLKAAELASLTGATLAEVIAQAHHGIARARRTPHLAYSLTNRRLAKAGRIRFSIRLPYRQAE